MMYNSEAKKKEKNKKEKKNVILRGLDFLTLANDEMQKRVNLK